MKAMPSTGSEINTEIVTVRGAVFESNSYT
jgi:hypothetical protein